MKQNQREHWDKKLKDCIHCPIGSRNSNTALELDVYLHKSKIDWKQKTEYGTFYQNSVFTWHDSKGLVCTVQTNLQCDFDLSSKKKMEIL